MPEKFLGFGRVYLLIMFVFTTLLCPPVGRAQVNATNVALAAPAAPAAAQVGPKQADTASSPVTRRLHHNIALGYNEHSSTWWLIHRGLDGTDRERGSSSVDITFTKTRRSFYEDWLFIGEVELFGVPRKSTINVLENPQEEVYKPTLISPNTTTSFQSPLQFGPNFFKFTVEPGYSYSFIVNTNSYNHLLSSKGEAYSVHYRNTGYQSQVMGEWDEIRAPGGMESPGKSAIMFNADAGYYPNVNLDVDSDRPILPVADGSVAKTANLGDGLGQAVWVYHTLNGQPYTSLYAHMRDLRVSVGTIVKGNATTLGYISQERYAKHLHLELFKKHTTVWTRGYSYGSGGQVDPLGQIFDKDGSPQRSGLLRSACHRAVKGIRTYREHS